MALICWKFASLKHTRITSLMYGLAFIRPIFNPGSWMVTEGLGLYAIGVQGLLGRQRNVLYAFLLKISRC